VVGATVARLLHHHKHRWLRLLQTLGSWSGLHPLPPIGQLTDRWSPRTVTPHHEVVKAARVPSMVGAHTLTQLHWRSGLHHGDMRGGGGRRRTTADLGHLRPIPRAADPPDGEEDRWSMRSTPRTTRTKNHHAARLADTLPHTPLAPMPPPSEAGLSGSGMPSDVKSPCGNRII
jgi:hypothetical protein